MKVFFVASWLIGLGVNPILAGFAGLVPYLIIFMGSYFGAMAFGISQDTAAYITAGEFLVWFLAIVIEMIINSIKHPGQ